MSGGCSVSTGKKYDIRVTYQEPVYALLLSRHYYLPLDLMNSI